jgi:uncharacterized membrane protein YkoI
MKRWITCAALLLAIGPVTITAEAQQHGEQGPMRRQTELGSIHPLPQIERDVLPRMPGMQYLGPEYDPQAMVYRLKFIRDGRVVYVDVDARTGRVIKQSH